MFPHPTLGLLRSHLAVRGHTPGAPGKRGGCDLPSLLVPPTQGPFVLGLLSGETSTQPRTRLLPRGLHGCTRHPHLLPPPLGLLHHWPTRPSCWSLILSHPASLTLLDSRLPSRKLNSGSEQHTQCDLCGLYRSPASVVGCISTTNKRQKAQPTVLYSAGSSLE